MKYWLIFLTLIYNYSNCQTIATTEIQSFKYSDDNKIISELRYRDNIFDITEISADIIYGNSPALSSPYMNENSTANINLLLDLYEPAGDTIAKRKTIIFNHSGAFLSGSKENDDMIAFCDTFARKGYVCVSINYRLGMNVYDQISSKRAVYRGLQDTRAAIRFLKEKSNIYRIDTNNIFMAGSSKVRQASKAINLLTLI